jgi:hypothetical protein
LVLGWLGDDSPAPARTLALARAEIAAFVRLLAPWPSLQDARPSNRPRSAPEPRALPAPVEGAEVSSATLSLPVAAHRLPDESESAAVQPAVVQAEAASTVAVNAAIAHAPAILGTLAQPGPAVQPLVSLAPEAGASRSEPAQFDGSLPAPIQPGGENAAARSKRRSRAKRSKH